MPADFKDAAVALPEMALAAAQEAGKARAVAA